MVLLKLLFSVASNPVVVVVVSLHHIRQWTAHLENTNWRTSSCHNNNNSVVLSLFRKTDKYAYIYIYLVCLEPLSGRRRSPPKERCVRLETSRERERER